jgi:hypothetical protein
MHFFYHLPFLNNIKFIYKTIQAIKNIFVEKIVFLPLMHGVAYMLHISKTSCDFF